MLHIILHFVVPIFVAFIFFRNRWRYVFLILIATMFVDLDHLFADPVYDPERCSIGFHPLHSLPAIACYGLLFILPFIPVHKLQTEKLKNVVDILHLAGLGLLIHMALDWLDCLL